MESSQVPSPARASPHPSSPKWWICLSVPISSPPPPVPTPLPSGPSASSGPRHLLSSLWSLIYFFFFPSESIKENSVSPGKASPVLMVVNIYLDGCFISWMYLFIRTYLQRVTGGNPVLLKIVGCPFRQPRPTISHSSYWYLSFFVK